MATQLPDLNTVTTDSADYLKVRAYLYKYTPPFTPPGINTQNTNLKGVISTQAQQNLQTVQSKYFSADVIQATKDIATNYIKELNAISSNFVDQPLLAQTIDNILSNKYRIFLDDKRNPDPTTVPRNVKSTVTFLTGVISLANTALNQINGAQAAAANIENLNNQIKEQQFKIQRYTFPFEETYLSRFDITPFVKGYSYSQSLSESNLKWKLDLSDEIIPFSQLGVEGNAVRRPIRFPTSTGEYQEVKANFTADQLISLIAQYQSEVTVGFQDEVDRIEVAMRLRGISDPARKDIIIGLLKGAGSSANQILVLKENTIRDKDGIKLSDLIQKYSMVSAFVYNYPFSSDIVENAASTSNPNFFDEEGRILYTPTDFKNDADSANHFPMYEVEFNGFVVNLSSTSAVGAVNQISIDGHGILTLFESTRRIYSPTIFQRSIFDYAEIMGVQDPLTTYQNLFVDKTPSGILFSLLQALYHIKTPSGTIPYIDIAELVDFNLFGVVSSGKSSTQPNTTSQLQGGVIPSSQPAGAAVGSRNIFSIPVYLYANVMRMRKFNVLAKVNGSLGVFETNTSQLTFSKNADGVGGSILDVSQVLTSDSFKPYFKFLENSLGDYNPNLKTPLEIMQEISKICYLEFFETPGGRIVFRTPQYNNSVPLGNFSDTNRNMLTSDQIIPVSVNYSQTAKNFVTKHQVSFGVDFLKQIPQQFYHYTNGKTLAQYGLFMGQTQPNPNVRFKEGVSAEKWYSGIFEYCRFFLEYADAEKQVGKVQVVGNPYIQVGLTYFDINNQKFGYITKVEKKLIVGQDYTANFDLSMVRDTSFSPSLTSDNVPSFKQLPTLEGVVKTFGNGVDIPVNKPQQPSNSVPRRDIIIQKILSILDAINAQRKNGQNPTGSQIANLQIFNSQL